MGDAAVELLRASKQGRAGARSRSVQPPAYIWLAATAIYVAALLLNAFAGMPMPPIPATRLIASLSVFTGAPALVWLVVLIVRGHGSKRMMSRIALAAVIAFATIAILNRVTQLAIIAQPAGNIDPRFDLYTPYSPANFSEMFAWDLCLGIAAVAVSRLLLEPREAWAGRMFAFAGLMMLLGEVLYVMTLLGIDGSVIGLAGMGVSVVAWVLALPGAALCVVIATRRTGRILGPNRA